MNEDEILPSPKLFDDDEVVADSEAEDGGPSAGVIYFADEADAFFHNSGVNPILDDNRASSISEFTATGGPNAPYTAPFSAISTFTASAAGADSSIIASSSRPQGKANGNNGSPNISFDFEDISSTATNIADRAKTRQRTQKKKQDVDLQDVIELSSEDDDELNLKLSTSKSKPKSMKKEGEKEKEKARPKPKPKIKIKEKDKEKEPDHVIPVSNTVSSRPPENLVTSALITGKPRPRPKPKVRPPRTDDKGPDSISAQSTSNPPTSTPPRGPDFPIATSPIFVPLRAINRLDSQLPPSDPPAPSIVSVPPIETVENDDGHRSASPSSLFSESSPAKKVKKRKYQAIEPEDEEEVDELAAATSEGFDQGRSRFGGGSGYGQMLPQPPTFFASSSSSSAIGTGVGSSSTSGEAIRSSVEQNIVDLTTLPPSAAPNTGSSKLILKIKKPKAKKSKVIYDDDFDEFEGAPRHMIILDEDEQDDDFDPADDGGGKEKKARTKAKEKKEKEKVMKEKGKGKKKVVEDKEKQLEEEQEKLSSTDGAAASSSTSNKSPASVSGKQQVEVIITSKTPTSRKKVKGKGKVKEKDKDQEIFKSREFIDDSGDETVNAGADTMAPIPPSRSNNAPSSGGVEVDVKAPSSKRASVGGMKRKIIVESDEEDELNLIDNEPAEQSDEARSSYALKSKKRKIIQEDDVVFEEKETSLSKPNSNKRGKGNRVMPDDEEGDSFVMENEFNGKAVKKPEKGRTKEKEGKQPKSSKSSSKRRIQDEDEKEEGSIDEDQVDSESPHKLTPEGTHNSIKENMTPAVSKTIYATPRPQLTLMAAPMTTPVNMNRSRSATPLYASYTVAPRKKDKPMSELIRHVNSLPGSPFHTPNAASGSSSKIKPLLFRTPTSTAYNPMLKSQRSLLSKIAPLHPNRRTPPPPPPPPPPKKKTKKQLELEEKWEEEMIEDVGGMEVWASMGDGERKEVRRNKWAKELGGYED